MANPNLWLLLIGLFVVAGALNLFRGLRKGHPRKSVNVGMALACVAWACAAGLFRFVGPAYGYSAAGIAAVIMVLAAVSGAKS